MIMPVTTSREVSMPMSMRYIVKKLRNIRPAPASSTSVSAICTTISPPDQRRARMPPDPVRPPSLSISCTLVADACSAGISPKIKPVARHTIRKNVNVRQSIENTIQYGMPTFCASRLNQRIHTIDSSSPTTPATNARRMLSMSS